MVQAIKLTHHEAQLNQSPPKTAGLMVFVPQHQSMDLVSA